MKKSYNMTFTDLCVYTIRHSDQLREIVEAGGDGVLEAGQSWGKAKRLLEMARAEGKLLPVVFAPAETTDRLFAWAVLNEIDLKDSNPRTLYHFSGLRLIKNRPSKTTLKKASDGERLSAGFIRPYAICQTPVFVRNDARDDDPSNIAPQKYLKDTDSQSAEEGNAALRNHLLVERDRGIIKSKRADVLRRTGKLSCEACGFDYLRTYGERGRGFCEVHHNVAFSERPGFRITNLDDLAILCSNCHRIIHRAPALTVKQLRHEIIPHHHETAPP